MFPSSRMPRFIASPLLLLCAALIGLAVHAADAHDPAEMDPSKTMHAVRVDQSAPRIDGRLDDEAWTRAPVYAGLTQQIPDDGEPATEPTRMQFAYDGDALYVAMVLCYSDRSLITAHLTRRDQTWDVDRFRVEIDSHHDHQTAYMFELTAAGVQRDAHVTRNGDGFDGNWDAVWEGRVADHPEGLSAEWRIPYQAVRFTAADTYTWGINVVRSIPLKHEMSYWERVPRGERGWVSRFGHLVGMEGISPARALELLPYAVGRDITYPGAERDADLSARVGADIRYGLSHSTSLNATVNPDFGQVEADPAELNLTVFETFQSERRPFFVEGAQMFDTPIDLFYSRRIGRQPGYLSAPNGWNQGERPDATTVLGALKLTGKTPGGTSFGWMEALTAAEHVQVDSANVVRDALIEPRTHFLAGRLTQDVLGSSHVGVLATALNREDAGDAWSGGVDWKLNSPENDYEFVGQMAASHAGGESGWGSDVEVGKRTGRWQAEARLIAFSPEFRINDMGYLRRADLVETHVNLNFDNEDPWRICRKTGLWLSRWRRWNFDDVVLQDGLGGGGSCQFLNYWSMGGGRQWYFRASDDRETRGGPLIATPASDNFWIWLENDWRQPYNAWAEFGWGGDSASSRTRSLDGGVTLKPWACLEVKFNPGYTWKHDDAQWIDNVDTDGDGTVDQYLYGELDSKTLDFTTRVNLILNPRLSLEAYVQPFLSVGDYEGYKALAAADTYRFDAAAAPADEPDFRSRSLRSNVVLRYEYRPGSTLFLVWSQNRGDRTAVPRLRAARNLLDSFSDPGTNLLFVKATYWLNP